jgi:hypothetical protein
MSGFRRLIRHFGIISEQIAAFCAVIRPQSAARTNGWRIVQPIERSSPSVKSTFTVKIHSGRR